IVETAKEEAKELLKHIKLLQSRKKMIKMDLKAQLESYMEMLGLNDEKIPGVKKTAIEPEKPLLTRKKNES
ncbi:MAG: hypothetical protein WC002_02355, partial [Candidatus Muiribacteriota bacterium]